MSQFPDPNSLLKEAQDAVAKASSTDALEEVRITWMGRKEGRLTLLMKQLGTLSMDDKKRFGPQYNELKSNLENLLTAKEKSLTSHIRSQQLEKDTFDTTLPGTPLAYGHLHPISQVMDQLVSIFRTLGF